MAYSTPLTAVSNSTLTAAQWNASVRDDILETAPAKATQSGQIFVATGANAIAARRPDSNLVTTSQSTGSTTYTDLTTVGPSITVTTGARALVIVSCDVSNNTLGQNSWMSFAVSGDSTVAASDTNALHYQAWGANAQHGGDRHTFIGNLNPGSNQFTAKYRVDAGSATFSNRRITVLGF